MHHKHFPALEIALAVAVGVASMGRGATADAAPTKPLTFESGSQVAAVDAENGRIAISTGQGGQMKKRVEAGFTSVKRFEVCQPVESGNPSRHGIEVRSKAGEVEFTLMADDRGVFEFKPGKARQLFLRGLKWRYAMLPSLASTDIVYDPTSFPGMDGLHIPALNMLVGLADGEDSMAVGVWPSGRQAATLNLEPRREPKWIDGLAFDTDGKSFYLSFQAKPGIWHAESLKRNYLEKDTTIAWKRPFEAKWIGRFFITSDEYDWPFYFVDKPRKIWGRYIRGWYQYPVRFDGDRTVVHFEKEFRPKGELLIYCLEPHPDRPEASILTPAEVMARALGKKEADRILDPEGAVEQTLLDHRLAVCAMTNTMQSWFDKGQEAARRDQIARWCDDVSAFIGMIRRRDQDFAAFARDLDATLADEAKARPELAASVAELHRPLREIYEIAGQELPSVPLETVQQWTGEMKKAADEVRAENAKTYGKLAGQCRNVAGTQDDLARDLSIRVIRLTEQAARIGAVAPTCRMAEEIILKARQLLRKPTWWEPARRFVPKSDPGNTF